MQLKKSHTLASALMISSILSPATLSTQESVLGYHGVHVNNEQAALLFNRPDVAAKLATQGMPLQAQKNLREFIEIHDANPPMTPIVEIDEQQKAVTALRDLGINTKLAPQDAKKFSDKAEVVKAYNEFVMPSGHVISPMEYLAAHEACPPGTHPLDVIHRHVGGKALEALGKNITQANTMASQYFAKQGWLDRMAELLKSVKYLQQNPGGNLAAPILEPSLPQMRATKFLRDSGVGGPTDRDINTIAYHVGVNQALSPDEVRETVRLAALRVNFIPDRDQIREGLRQMDFGLGAPSIEQIDEGLRQKRLEIGTPDPYYIIEGLRLATLGLVESSKDDLIAALTLQNPRGAPIIPNPDIPQVQAMRYLMTELSLMKPSADKVNAVVNLRNPGGLLKMPKPELKHILGFLRLGLLGDHNPTRARLLATAYLVDPDGLNENPADFKRIDCVVHLQGIAKIDEPSLPEIDAAQYLMDPGLHGALIPLPTREDIRATVYWRKSLQDGGLGDLNPTVDNIRTLAHLQKPVIDGGLNMAKPALPQIRAAKHLFLTLTVNPFTPEDLAAVMDLQARHGNVLANARADLEYIKAVKCLLGHGKGGIYTLQELEATKYLQTNPRNALGGAAIDNPEWGQIQGTVYLWDAGGLGILNPSRAHVNAVVHSRTVLGLEEAVYLTPTIDQIKAIIHLQGPLVNKQAPSIKDVRATVLLQTPGPRGLGGYGMAGAILDPNPSPRRISAMVELQDWQRPAAHAGVATPRPTISQIDAVARAYDHPHRMKAIAWAIQEGFGGQGVGTIPTVLGHFIEAKDDGFHYFRLVPLEDNATAAFDSLPVSLEPVRDRLFNHADGTHVLRGTTGFRVADVHIAGLKRLVDGKLPAKDFVLGMGLTADPMNADAVIITSPGNRPD